MSQATLLIQAIERGESDASGKLLPIIYDELRRIAAQKINQEKPGQTLQGTALVHEAYIRLIGDNGLEFQNRSHFFVAAAEAMRPYGQFIKPTFMTPKTRVDTWIIDHS